MSLRGRTVRRVQATAQYTYGHANNDTNGINYLPANNYDLSRRVSRRRFRPAASVRTFEPDPRRAVAEVGCRPVCGLWHPVSIRTGRDEFNNGQTNARPEGVARNTMEGPASSTLDLRWTRAFRFGARI